jgi:hypothetical protein
MLAPIGSHLGFYRVGEKTFASKFEALIYATTIGASPMYHYYDEVWDAALPLYKHNTNTNFLSLYKERAQRIRDKFDYLVLHFSGGVDSTTALQSFVFNSIKLDEVYVRWPLKLLESSVYTPNPNDRRATNMLSEWDFSIKPKLDWVKANHPEIKIVIEDWTDELYKTNLDTFSESLFHKHNHNFGLANFIYSEMVSKSSLEAQAKGLRVGHIYGAEKPLITYDSGTDSFFMFFTDIGTASVGFQHSFNKFDTADRVDFYHAPDFPQLTIARATAMARHIRNNPGLTFLVDSKNIRLPETERTLLSDGFQKLCARVMHPNWDPLTFQVAKMDVSNRLHHPWYHYVFNNTEFIDKQNKIETVLKDLSFGVADRLKTFDRDGSMVGVKPVRTKFFKLNENQKHEN